MFIGSMIGGRISRAAGASLDLSFLTGVLDSRIAFSRNSIGTRVNSAGLIETIAANQPRFDYDPITLLPRGVLVEEARTNLELYSDDFTNPVWIKGSASISTPGTKLNPKGQPAQKIVENAANTIHYCGAQQVGVKDNVPYTWTRFVAASERTWVCFELVDRANVFRYASFNLAAGTWGTVSSGITTKVTPYPNGWYKFELSVAASTGSTNTKCTVFPALGDGSGANISYLGDGSSGIFISSFQSEIGSFATSVIPTVGAAVTRARDTLLMSDISWFNPAGGMFVVQGDAKVTAGSGIFVSIASNIAASANCSPQLDVLPTGAVRSYFSGSAVDNISLAGFTYTMGSMLKMAVSYSSTQISLAANNVSQQSARTSTSAPTTVCFGGMAANDAINGHLCRVAFYPGFFNAAAAKAMTV